MNDLAIIPVEPSAQELFSATDRSIRVVAVPHPFKTERTEHAFVPGVTLQEIVEIVQPNPRLRHAAHVFIGDELIARDHWRLVRPKPHTTVTVRCVPMGGGNKILRSILFLVLAIAGAAITFFSAGTLGPAVAALLGTLFTTLGGFLINTLIPPAQPKLKNLSSGPESPTLAITGARNQLNIYGPIPRLYGRHRIVPPYGARPYTEILGKNQWLRLLFDCGYGPLQLSELKIGETAIEDFEEVQVEIRQGYDTDEPMELYSRSVFEEPLSILLSHLSGSPPAESWSVRKTQPDADEISIDITFPQGLTQFLADGGRIARKVEVAVEYSVSDADDWKPISGTLVVDQQTTGNAPAPTAGLPGVFGTPTGAAFRLTAVSLDPLTGVAKFRRRNDDIPICTVKRYRADGNPAELIDERPSYMTDQSPDIFTPTLNANNSVTVAAGVMILPKWIITDNSTAAVRAGVRVSVPRGQYDVRLKRITDDATLDSILDVVYWTALRTIRTTPPVTEAGHCLIAMRIKATDQLNGVVDEFNCIAESILLDFDGGQWLERATSNPAAIDIDVLRGSATEAPVGDDLFDIATYEQWSLANAEAHREFNAVIDFETTVFDMRKMVCAAGRAAPTMRDGKFSIVRDIVQTVPVQHFTPRNSWGFKGSRAFPDMPHALRINFTNRTTGWRPDERIVYADGYSAGNATRFDKIDMFGITDPEQVWKDGRYLIAVGKLRPETFQLNCDFEHLVASQGDLVYVTHDVIAVGVGSGRIKTITEVGSTVTEITVDETFLMLPGSSYGVSIRNPAGQVTAAVVNIAGDTNTLTFLTPIDFVGGSSPIAVGDLLGFGELGRETLHCLVKTVEPAEEMSALLTFVSASPAVHDAEFGTIPPFDPMVTELPRVPLPPTIVSVDSGDLALLLSKDGTIQSRIVIGLAPIAGGVPAVRFQAQFRPSGTAEAWVPVPDAMASSPTLSIMPVQDGLTYDIRVRGVGALGYSSEWVYVLAHLVLGKAQPPPTPDTFVVARLADGTRRFTWTLDTLPADVRVGGGFVIKYFLGATADWTAMTVLPPGFMVGYSLETNELPAGTYTFAIKTVDSSNNESLVARFIDGAVLDDPAQKGVIYQSQEQPLWAGTRTSVFLEQGILYAVSVGGWDDLPSQWDGLSATWDAVLPQVTPIRYETVTIDVGVDIPFTPAVVASGNGAMTIEMKTGLSSGAGVLGAYGALARVTARYIKLRVSVAGSAPTLRTMQVTLSAELVEEDFNDIPTDSNKAWFQTIAAGHFLVHPTEIAIVARASITAFQNAGSGWTWELISKASTYTPKTIAVPAVEFKIYKDGVLTDATVDINIKGLK